MTSSLLRFILESKEKRITLKQQHLFCPYEIDASRHTLRGMPSRYKVVAFIVATLLFSIVIYFFVSYIISYEEDIAVLKRAATAGDSNAIVALNRYYEEVHKG